MKIKSALKAAALATTLAFAGASHAAIDIPLKDSGQVLDYGVGGSMLSGASNQPVETYNVTDSSLAAQILAFCVEPTVMQKVGAFYTQQAAVTSVSSISLFSSLGSERANRIQALFEQNYGSLNSSADRLGFALALWDLVGDDGSLNSGAQHFTGDAIAFSMDDGETINLATVQHMLDATVGASLTGAYKYTLFTGSTDGGITNDSQALLSVSAVPEADTWAMMVVGLGLVGFMGRRKTDKSEKFAA